MIIDTPRGTHWHLVDVNERLSLRARLPGARVFDLAAGSLRAAKRAGMSETDRLHLALASSWLVNSPAVSRVLRRWALPPERDVWVALVEMLDKGDARLLLEATRELLPKLGGEPYLVEAVSKVLALLVPEAVPLMPPPALAFVLGEGTAPDASAFVRMVDWFVKETRANAAALEAYARRHEEAPLVGPQVLDRMIWFDSDGYRHFPQTSSATG